MKFKNCAIYFLVLFTQIIFANSLYYGQYTENKMQNMDSKQLRKTLRKILESYHLQKHNSPDVILGLNPPLEIASHQRLIKHKAMPYLEAKAYMYKHIAPRKLNGINYMKTLYCNELFQFPKSYKSTQQLTKKLSINAEHVWPKSRFSHGSKKKRLSDSRRIYQVADLHHIFASQMKVNETRSSYMFAEVSLEARSPNNSLNLIIKNMNKKSGDGYFGLAKPVPGLRKNKHNNNMEHDIYFEPPTSAKGEIARAILYFSIRYSRPISSTEFFFIKRWHIENPPTEFERERNNTVYKYQHNRNPFIDHPWLINYLEDKDFLTVGR